MRPKVDLGVFARCASLDMNTAVIPDRYRGNQVTRWFDRSDWATFAVTATPLGIGLQFP